MSEPKFCPGCPTGGRITGVEPILDPGTDGPLKRIIKLCSKSRYHPSKKTLRDMNSA